MFFFWIEKSCNDFSRTNSLVTKCFFKTNEQNSHAIGFSGMVSSGVPSWSISPPEHVAALVFRDSGERGFLGQELVGLEEPVVIGLEELGCWKRIRLTKKYPIWIFWEQVWGVLIIGFGRDFMLGSDVWGSAEPAVEGVDVASTVLQGMHICLVFGLIFDATNGNGFNLNRGGDL